MTKEKQIQIFKPLKVLSLVLLALLLLVPAASAETYTLIDEDLEFKVLAEGSGIKDVKAGDAIFYTERTVIASDGRYAVVQLSNSQSYASPIRSYSKYDSYNFELSESGNYLSFGYFGNYPMYTSYGTPLPYYFESEYVGDYGGYDFQQLPNHCYVNGEELDLREYTEDDPLIYFSDFSGCLAAGAIYQLSTWVGGESEVYGSYGDATQIYSEITSGYSAVCSHVQELSSLYPDCYFLVQIYGSGNGGNYAVCALALPLDVSFPRPTLEPHHVTVTYTEESERYTFTLERKGNPIYLAITGKAFGFIPVYTYTTVQDESLDVTLSDLPSRWFVFDIDYHADVYQLGSGLESNGYKSYNFDWTLSDFLTEDGEITDPDIPVEEGGKIDITPLVPNPPDIEPGGYDTPGIEDIDHDGIHNSEDDDMDGDGIPNEEDDDPYTPGESGLLGNLGFTLGFTLPDIESITDMVRNMKLPASLKEMFNIPLPDEYKAGIALEEGHVLYGYQQLWFGLGDGVIGLFMGIILVIAALIACIPRFLFEFFSSLIEWLNVAFHSFYDWLVIPSEIFKLVIGLLPDELLAIALLLFGIDLVFLFFQFVLPGLIGGSHALGDIVEYDDALRLAEEERIKAEEHIGSGHGWHPKKGGVKHVVVKRPSSSIRGKGDYDPDSESAEHIQEIHKRMYPSRRRK